MHRERWSQGDGDIGGGAIGAFMEMVWVFVLLTNQYAIQFGPFQTEAQCAKVRNEMPRTMVTTTTTCHQSILQVIK